jgi:hypothetical protein
MTLARWLLAPYFRRRTRKARLDRYRLLSDWCDYKPAHHHVTWTAAVDGEPFGQSCFTHLGALLVDACRAGEDMTLTRR